MSYIEVRGRVIFEAKAGRKAREHSGFKSKEKTPFLHANLGTSAASTRISHACTYFVS